MNTVWTKWHFITNERTYGKRLLMLRSTCFDSCQNTAKTASSCTYWIMIEHSIPHVRNSLLCSKRRQLWHKQFLHAAGLRPKPRICAKFARSYGLRSCNGFCAPLVTMMWFAGTNRAKLLICMKIFRRAEGSRKAGPTSTSKKIPRLLTTLTSEWQETVILPDRQTQLCTANSKWGSTHWHIYADNITVSWLTRYMPSLLIRRPHCNNIVFWIGAGELVDAGKAIRMTKCDGSSS